MNLDNLEPEVLVLILEYVNDTSPATTPSIALTNKYIYSVSRLLHSRHLKYRFEKNTGNDDFLKKCKAWADDDTTLANVRTLTITGSAESLSTNSDWTSFATFISKIGKLRRLDWNIYYRIPLCVLDALHKHQKHATLRMFDFCPAFSTTPDAVARALAESPAITHLRTRLRYIGQLDTQQREFCYITARAPKLEYAGLITLHKSAIHETSDSSPPTIFPNRAVPNTSLTELTLDGFAMSKETLDFLSKLFNLSALRKLKFSRGPVSIDYFQNSATMIPNVEHVSLNLSQIVKTGAMLSPAEIPALLNAVNQYLTTCKPCKTLSLWSWREAVSVQDLVETHGSSLTSLQLHEREMAGITRTATTAKELEIIADRCPNLRKLTIDLNRSRCDLKLDNDDGNFCCFDTLKRMRPTLKHLTIYFDIGLAYVIRNLPNPFDIPESEDSLTDGEIGEDNEIGSVTHTSEPSAKRARSGYFRAAPTSDEVMEKYIKEIWQMLFKDDKMGKLDVKVGEWESIKRRPRVPNLGNVVHENEYLRARHFVVRPVERDDRVGCTIKKLTVNDHIVE